MIYTDGVTEGYLENGEELQVKGLEKTLKIMVYLSLKK